MEHLLPGWKADRTPYHTPERARSPVPAEGLATPGERPRAEAERPGPIATLERQEQARRQEERRRVARGVVAVAARRERLHAALAEVEVGRAIADHLLPARP